MENKISLEKGIENREKIEKIYNLLEKAKQHLLKVDDPEEVSYGELQEYEEIMDRENELFKILYSMNNDYPRYGGGWRKYMSAWKIHEALIKIKDIVDNYDIENDYEIVNIDELKEELREVEKCIK